MASIVKRGKKYYVVYLYTNEYNERKQKWECFTTRDEAEKRKSEVEYKKDIGCFIIPKCSTLEELLQEYVNLYGKNSWALSTYSSNTRLIQNYILPHIGSLKLNELTPRIIERYYQTLLRTEAVSKKLYGWREVKTGELVSVHTVRDIHKLLRNCFGQAVKWELMEKKAAQSSVTVNLQSVQRIFQCCQLIIRQFRTSSFLSNCVCGVIFPERRPLAEKVPSHGSGRLP